MTGRWLVNGWVTSREVWLLLTTHEGQQMPVQLASEAETFVIGLFTTRGEIAYLSLKASSGSR